MIGRFIHTRQSDAQPLFGFEGAGVVVGHAIHHPRATDGHLQRPASEPAARRRRRIRRFSRVWQRRRFARLDWKVYARTGKAFVRLHQDETNLLCTLAIDNSRSMNFPDRSQTRSARIEIELCTLSGNGVELCDFAGARSSGCCRCLVKMPRRCCHPVVQPSHIAHVQKIIAEFATQQATVMAPALRRLYEAARRSSVLILFSDFLMDDLDAVFAQLRMFRHDRCEVIALHLVHPDEERLPAGAAFRFFDPGGCGAVAMCSGGNSS